MTEQKIVKEKHEERLVRILATDIEGKTNIYPGLTKIKGISWAFSNAICKKLNLPKNKKIGSLTEEEIKKLSEFIKNPQVPTFMMNRKFDFETGENKHYIGSELDLQKEFDIKRLKKIKSYKGIRHAANLPVRGQRTKSHFRVNRKRSGGVKSAATKKKE
jgi:small subunit ribosomal protein S13